MFVILKMKCHDAARILSMCRYAERELDVILTMHVGWGKPIGLIKKQLFIFEPIFSKYSVQYTPANVHDHIWESVIIMMSNVAMSVFRFSNFRFILNNDARVIAKAFESLRHITDSQYAPIESDLIFCRMELYKCQRTICMRFMGHVLVGSF